MIKKLLVVTLSLTFLLAGCVEKTDGTDKKVNSIRQPNVNNYTVMDADLGEVVVKDGELFVEGQSINVGDMVPSEKYPTLSIIEDCIYVNGEKGLERYNLATKVFEPMYYDVSVFSFAGERSIFYISNVSSVLNLYKLSNKDSSVEISRGITADAYLLYDNGFYYVAEDMLTYLDLVEERVESLEMITSPIESITVTEGELSVKTKTDTIKVPLK